MVETFALCRVAKERTTGATFPGILSPGFAVAGSTSRDSTKRAAEPALLGHTVLFVLFDHFVAMLVEGLDRVRLARYTAHSAQLFALFQMRILG